MSEDNDTDHHLAISRTKHNQTDSENQQFKLPKLAPPSSRGKVQSRKQNKMPLHLPSINDNENDQKTFRNTQMLHINRSQTDTLKAETQQVKDEFVLDVQDKLKLLMYHDQTKTNQPLQQQENQKSDSMSDDLDFEQKILQNKQIIKMHRQKNDPFADKKKSFQMVDRFNDNKTKMMKPQSNYQRKMKEYNLSLENKYLQRKKQSLGIIPEKPQRQPMERAKSKKVMTNLQQPATYNQLKSNFGYKQFKNSAIGKAQSRQGSVNFNKNAKQQLSISQRSDNAMKRQNNKTQLPPSPSKKIHRTSALFDNIQSFLQNPISVDKQEKIYRDLFKKLKTKSIPKLQEKLRQLNQKMGTNQNYDTKQTIGKQSATAQPIIQNQNPLQRTVRDWKRIDIKNKTVLNCKQSDFQKELQYISYLQEKSSASLSKFIDHQKLMIALQLNKRFPKSTSQEKPFLSKQSRVSQPAREQHTS